MRSKKRKGEKNEPLFQINLNEREYIHLSHIIYLEKEMRRKSKKEERERERNRE